MAVLEQVEGQTGIFDKEDAAARQAQIYADAVHRWIVADPARFKEVSETILSLAIENAPIQQGRIHAECVARGIYVSDSAMFANDRNNWMGLARYLRAFYPELKRHIHIRKSAMDGLTLKAVPFGYFFPGAQCQNRPITRRDWE